MQHGPTQQRADVIENICIGKDTYRIRLRNPQIASSILPGQFVMVRIPHRTAPLLGRPFALYDTVDNSQQTPEAIDIVYLVMGEGTRALSTLKPEAVVDVWGPMGNTFPTTLPESQRQHLFLAAGGIGQTPFLALAKEVLGLRTYGDRSTVLSPNKVSFAWGVRSEDLLGGLEDFEALGIDVKVATNDASRGHQGYVTDLLEQSLKSDEPPTAVFACGPEPMLHKLASVCEQAKLPAWVSLETKMACGYGVCFSCVCPVLEETGWDYRRVCLEGPVFSSREIEWTKMPATI